MNVLEYFDLSGKTAFVTGAGRGLGRQAALALAEAGADVSICDLLLDESRETHSMIESMGRKGICEKVDVTDTTAIDSFLKEILAKWGKIDILVNNAGIPSDGLSLENEDDAAWRKMIDTNLSSMFYVGKRVARHMMKRGEGGTIINVASINSFIISNITPRHNVPYCTAKGGVAQLTKGMASDWAPYNIRVNAIAPGYIKTAQTANSRNYPEIVERTIASTPMRRYGTEEEIKGTIIYLASQASSFMTGSIIVIDGGITIW